MIKACIFDLDGTLCNTLDSIAYFCNQTLKQLRISEIYQQTNAEVLWVTVPNN